MPPILYNQRRQAQPQFHRAAMLNRIHAVPASICPSPPGPPTSINMAPEKDSLKGSGGGAIAFNHTGSRRHLRNPVDQGRCNYVTARGTKHGVRFAIFGIPRKYQFCPRNGFNRPHACFCVGASIYLYLSLFLEEREEKRGAAAKEKASTGKIPAPILYPRICRYVHVFFVDGKWAESQCRCGLQPVWWPVHTSTARNALPGAQVYGQGVRHGR